MDDSLMHPQEGQLEALVEDTLPAGERAVVESHLEGCARCRQAVEGWRALFSALSSLPRPEPAPGFASRVMARVRVRKPWPVRATEWAEVWGRRLVPQTMAGWALVAALVALPVLTLGGATTWLVTRPWFSAQWFAMMAQERAGAAFASGLAWLGELILESPAAGWLAAVAEPLVGAGAAGVGAAAATFATLTLTSGWILYRNLVREPAQERSHVTYSF